jgi:DNA-binding LacI/PurR family transcriptional regulator
VGGLRLPSAFVGHPRDLRPEIPYVGIDNLSSSEEITRRLIDTGRRRIGMIASAVDRDSGADRLTGFQRALGPLFDEKLVAEVPLYDFAWGARGMRTLLERDPAIDGVFGASDAVAAGAMEALREAGRAVPEDVGVVGFDDSSWATRTRPQLSTVHQPAGDIGSRAAELVLRQLRRDPIPQGGILLPSPVVWRASA